MSLSKELSVLQRVGITRRIGWQCWHGHLASTYCERRAGRREARSLLGYGAAPPGSVGL